MQKINWLLRFTPCFFLFLTACASHQTNLNNVDTTNLSQLESIKIDPRAPTAIPGGLSPLRQKSLEDSAMSIGAQGGLAWASSEINAKMNKDRKYLDTIFNFQVLMLNHGVMPPVLETGDFSLNLADPNTIRVADRTYKIVQQARFVTTPPNWREYLLLPYSKPDLPNRTLLPRSSEEMEAWRRGVRAGWDKGIQQAYSIFQQNMARLKRDYRGMLLYRKLLEQRMISPPFVARTEMGITGDGNDMRINDQVLRIVESAKLQTNGRSWNAIVVKNNE
jgi:defect-in-organelle-trafficking protein DotC